jgi:hypothetical protein
MENPISLAPAREAGRGTVDEIQSDFEFLTLPSTIVMNGAALMCRL